MTWRSEERDEELVVHDDGSVTLDVLHGIVLGNGRAVGRFRMPAGARKERSDAALRREVLRHPASVISCSTSFTAFGADGVLNLVVDAVGRDAVSFMFDPDGFRCGSAAMAPPPIGLMSAGAELVDGIVAPARLAPGQRAALAYLGAPADASRNALTVRGRILLADPDAVDIPVRPRRSCS